MPAFSSHPIINLAVCIMGAMNYRFVIILGLLIVGSDKVALAANNHAAPSDSALMVTHGESEARGDWYNEIGFPQQFFWSRAAMFSVWLFYMLAFLKVFLVWGIWAGWAGEKDQELPDWISNGYDHGNNYYSYPSWQNYG